MSIHRWYLMRRRQIDFENFVLRLWCADVFNFRMFPFLNVKKIVNEQTEPHWFWYIKLWREQYIRWWLYFSLAYKITFLLNLMCFCFFGLTEPFKVENKLKTYFAFIPCQCLMSYAIEWLSYHWLPILKNELFGKQKENSKILHCTVASCEFSMCKTV